MTSLGLPGQDFDDLLYGIGSDDLNDFEEEIQHDERNALLDRDEDDHSQEEWSDVDSIDRLATPTAPNNTVVSPVHLTHVQASRCFNQTSIDQHDVLDEDDERSDPYAQKRRRLDRGGSPFLSGFSTGNGKAVPPPSRDALRRAMQIMGDLDGEEEDEPSKEDRTAAVSSQSARHTYSAPDQTPSSPPARTSGFSTGNGNAIAGPSSAALKAVYDLFGDAREESSMPRPAEIPPEGPALLLGSGFTTGGGKPVAKPSRESILRATALLSDVGEEPDRSESSTPLVRLLAEQPVFLPPKPSLAPATQTQSSTLSTPFRTPLRTTTNIFTHREQQTPLRQKQAVPIQIKTPATAIRRVGMGLTPVSRNRAKKSFVTPFKHQTGLAGSISRPTTPRTSLLPRPQSTKFVQPATTKPVFNLIPPQDRENLLAAYLHPGYYEIAELQEMGLPNELWSIDLDNAPFYQFIAEDASCLGTAEAFAILLKEQCRLATQRWVTNHYSEILWKLAGEIRAKPSLWNAKWNWAEVISQLLYRYEREIGHAQRPIIRRIQEHDSSPSLPLVLCITAIRHSPPNVDDRGKVIAVKPYLELSDGWYRVVAEIDDCLSRAVSRGKVAIGRKLAISGAKLESGSDGAEVLDAFDKSRLIISGNSCSLARWHVRLGQQPRPFVAGLSSLSVDGGAVMLVDIVVVKLYPVAFMPTDKAVRDPPWNEDEEQLRADQWNDKYTAESARLHDEMRKQLEKMEDLTEQICGVAQDTQGGHIDSPPETLENDFEALLAANNPTARLRGFSDSHIAHLASYAQMRMQRELAEGHSEVEAELQSICPARDVRDFRMVRVMDAQNLRRDKMRVAMLNVWDARSLGEGALQEGKRYLVSNLMPGRNGDWRVPTEGETTEIYLHTRRDTRWKMVESG